MKLRLSKFLSSTLLIAIACNISIPASAKSFSINNEQLQIEKSSPLNIPLINEELILKADKYINIENDKYVLDNSIYNDSMLSANEIVAVKLNVENTNNVIKGCTNKTINNQKKSIEITFSNKEVKSAFEKVGLTVDDTASSRSSKGVNKLESYWWGYYIYLDSYYTGLAITVSTAVLATTISALFPPIAGYSASIASAMIAYDLGYKYGGSGVVISWNSLLGFQKAWSQ